MKAEGLETDKKKECSHSGGKQEIAELCTPKKRKIPCMFLKRAVSGYISPKKRKTGVRVRRSKISLKERKNHSKGTRLINRSSCEQSKSEENMSPERKEMVREREKDIEAIIRQLFSDFDLDFFREPDPGASTEEGSDEDRFIGFSIHTFKYTQDYQKRCIRVC
eukprot:snap_masked-scaffold_6-processed-gene-14.15-mRNA-1 protein AED:1.00 eAED:1.00 QI:0/-1/0/0/-1/1/1/0/163